MFIQLNVHKYIDFLWWSASVWVSCPWKKNILVAKSTSYDFSWIFNRTPGPVCVGIANALKLYISGATVWGVYGFHAKL